MDIVNGTQLNVETISGKAVGAVTGGRFGKRSATVADGWVLCTVQGEKVRGLFLFDALDGEEITVVVESDKITVEAGAAVLDAVEVMTDSSARAIPYVAGSGVYVCGVAQSAASGSGKGFLLRLQDSPSQ